MTSQEESMLTRHSITLTNGTTILFIGRGSVERRLKGLFGDGYEIASHKEELIDQTVSGRQATQIVVDEYDFPELTLQRIDEALKRHEQREAFILPDLTRDILAFDELLGRQEKRNKLDIRPERQKGHYRKHSRNKWER